MMIKVEENVLEFLKKNFGVDGKFKGVSAFAYIKEKPLACILFRYDERDKFGCHIPSYHGDEKYLRILFDCVLKDARKMNKKYIAMFYSEKFKKFYERERMKLWLNMGCKNLEGYSKVAEEFKPEDLREIIELRIEFYSKEIDIKKEFEDLEKDFLDYNENKKIFVAREGKKVLGYVTVGEWSPKLFVIWEFASKHEKTERKLLETALWHARKMGANSLEMDLMSKDSKVELLKEFGFKEFQEWRHFNKFI